MEELVTSLVERNIVNLTEIIETSSVPAGIPIDYLPILITFLIQKAGQSSSPQTIDWLYELVKEYPDLCRDISENYKESVKNINLKCPDIKTLYQIKGKLSLFAQIRNEFPEVSTATPEQLYEFSSEESEEVNYQEFSVIFT